MPLRPPFPGMISGPPIAPLSTPARAPMRETMTPADNSTRHAPVRMEIPDIRTAVAARDPALRRGNAGPARAVPRRAALPRRLGRDDRRPCLGLQRDRRPPVVAAPGTGFAPLGAVTLTARTIVAIISHSVVVYFLQPSLGTMLVATAFLIVGPARQAARRPSRRRLLPAARRKCTRTHTSAVLPSHLVVVGVRADDERDAHDLVVVLAVALDLRRVAQCRVLPA